MEGADNNLSQSDASTLKSLQEQLFAVKIENSGFDKLKRASKAGVALLQNPKIDQYAQSLGQSPTQFKADAKQQISRLESRAQQVQADREQSPETTEDGMPATVAAAATPAAAAEAAAKEDRSVPREGEEGRMNEEDAREEAAKVQELAKGNNGKPSGGDYQAASDLVDEQKQKEKEKPREGEPTNRMSLDESRADVAKNGGGTNKDWQKDPTQKLRKPDDRYKASGGRAVQPRSSQIRDGLNAVKDPKKQFEKQAEKAVATAAGKGAGAAMTAAGLGALAGAADAATKWATEKALPWLKKNKSWLMTPAFMIIILFGATGAGIAGSLMQRDGRNGGTQPEYGGVTDATYVAGISELVGKSYMIPGDPRSWYFSQADPKFNTAPLNGHWGKCRPYLECAGCTITSSTMMARYYGVTNITPVDYANRMANGGSLDINRDMLATYVNEHYKKIGDPRRKKQQMTLVAKSVESVKKAISQGDPILTKGVKAFGFPPKIKDSSSQHWVVIIGISMDSKYLIISDPAGLNYGGGRGSAARPVSIEQLSNGQIKELWVSENAS